MKNSSILSFNQGQRKVIVVGDVHGELGKLQAILEKEETSETLVFFLGDIVDRGCDSEKCLRLVLRRENYFSILGNHEDLMLHASESLAEYNWVRNGGGWCDVDTLQELCALIKDWPTVIELELDTGDLLGLVHSQIPSAFKTWDEFVLMIKTYSGARDAAMWDRDLMTNDQLTCDVPGIDMVIGGHTVVRSPTTKGKHIDIDTGACFGKPLTALVFEPGVNKDGYRTVQSIQLSDGTYRASDVC